MTPINSVRRLNWKRRHLRFGKSALGDLASIAALSPTAGSRSKGFWRPSFDSAHDVALVQVARSVRILNAFRPRKTCGMWVLDSLEASQGGPLP